MKTEALPSRVKSAQNSAAAPADPKPAPRYYNPEAVLLTKVQFAARFQVAKRTVENWMRRGFVNYLRHGKLVRFDEAEVELCRQRLFPSPQASSLPPISHPCTVPAALQQPGLAVVTKSLAPRTPAPAQHQRGGLKAKKTNKN